jgi:hypothetical protein
MGSKGFNNQCLSQPERGCVVLPEAVVFSGGNGGLVWSGASPLWRLHVTAVFVYEWVEIPPTW